MNYDTKMNVVQANTLWRFPEWSC